MYWSIVLVCFCQWNVFSLSAAPDAWLSHLNVLRYVFIS